MPYILKLSAGCPYCMAFHKYMPLQLGFQYIFRTNFDFSYDHYALSDISDKEPLFYHPVTETYFLGIPNDRRLLRRFISYMVRYDMEMTLYKYDKLPVPEEPEIVSKILGRLNANVVNFIYEKSGFAGLTTKEKVYDSETKLANRLADLMENL